MKVIVFLILSLQRNNVLLYYNCKTKQCYVRRCDMYISKKELLDLTGISYGQLYRWKREGLIPEDWFIKKSSYTGQETFFPKDKIIDRIREIQELKDQYSLEELAKLLSPEHGNDIFISEEYLADRGEEFAKTLSYYKKCVNDIPLKFFDFILVLAFQEIKDSLHLEDDALFSMMDLNVKRFIDVGSIDFIILVLAIETNHYLLLLKESNYLDMKKDRLEIYFDPKMKICKEISLSQLNDEFRKKNKELFTGGQ